MSSLFFKIIPENGMFYNEIFPWYISVTTHVLDFRIGTQSRKKETEEGGSPLWKRLKSSQKSSSMSAAKTML